MNPIACIILTAYMLLAPMIAWAQSVPNPKDPMGYPLKTYGFMLGVAVIGGLVSFYGKVRRKEVEALSVMHLIGEIATSAFAGLLTFWVCEYLGIQQILTAPIVGVSGHLGAKAINWAESALKQRAEAATGVKVEQP
jgi:hypothetical protein